jgi:multiple sugar transport system permease protein
MSVQQAPAAKGSRPTKRPRRSRSAHIAIFLIPFFSLFFLFTVVPVFYTAVLSFFSEQASGGLGLGEGSTEFVGFANYISALSSREFMSSFVTIGIYCLIYIPVLIFVALALAMLMDTMVERARKYFQLALYLPNIVPGIIASVIWLYLYTPGISPLAEAWTALGMTWSLDGDAGAIFAIMNTTVWAHVGYNVVLFYAALQAVPRDVLEAVTIDGAGPVTTALQIKLPLISGTVALSVLFTIIGAVQLFAEPFLLRSRATSITSTWTPNMFIYSAAFERHDFGLAAAASIIFAIIVGVSSFFVTRAGNLSGKRS